MKLNRILLVGAIVLIVGITILQVSVNKSGDQGGKKMEAGKEQFRVGFLPVT
jgi:hypothetical protein